MQPQGVATRVPIKSACSFTIGLRRQGFSKQEKAARAGMRPGQVVAQFVSVILQPRA
jgi:hypothetical protein